MPDAHEKWSSVEDLQTLLRENLYVADRGLATALHLAVSLERPLFLEGDAGVGKTEVAHVLSQILDAQMIRLQCYEGIGVAQAMYDWNYPRQFLSVRAAEAIDAKIDVDELFTWEHLVKRPLLSALTADGPTVLLIDEIDRADDEFEAFLLEVLSDYAMTIPEIGTVRADRPPIVILTSNRTRDVHDALKRRCFFHVIRHPDVTTEAEIIRLRAPEVTNDLASQVASLVGRLREEPLMKPPGVAESIDWARALSFLGVDTIDLELARETIGVAIKQDADLELMERVLPEIVASDG